MGADTLLQIAMMILAAAATYGAIRTDIKNIHEKLSEHERDINDAHRRIDDILLQKSGQHK